MPITSLRFTNVGLFDSIEIEFDRQVNVFTGPNNSGKSTVLWVLGAIVIYPFTFPSKLLRISPSEFGVRIDQGIKPDIFEGMLPISVWNEYWRSEQRDKYLATLKNFGYTSFIPALRRSTDYRAEGPVVHPVPQEGGLVRPLSDGVFDYFDFLRDVSGNFGMITGGTGAGEYLSVDPEIERRRSLISTNASLVSDEAVIQKIIELDYTAYRRQQPAIRGVIEGISSIASEITEGFPVQFLGVGEDQNGLFPRFRTPDGDVPLNVLSQGTQSIIQWLAHLLIGYAQYYDYPPDLEEKPGILIIDEIDAHLHPSWQRRIIPALTSHFPNLQIFCSTHSPLMLAGLKAGQVQLLRRDEQGKVTVSRNETDIIGWSADEILRNFLDVPNPTDLETAGHLERLQELRAKDSLSQQEADELETLRHTVSQDLLGGPMAQQLDQLTALLDQAKAGLGGQPETEPPAETRRARRRRKPAE